VNLNERRQALANVAEATLVVLAAGGEVEAFEELVRRREPRLRQFLRRVCSDNALADDLSQQAFLQAWMQLKTLRAPAAFGSWLRQLALNTALQQMRRRSERLDPDAGMDLPANEADPGLALDLERALERLRPDERICVVLCHAEGMSHGEIATHTGWPLGTVKSHVTRGSARLRAWLAPGALEET
jgi:RNA polymerase sigma-70 factor, ECF subfamily